MGRLGKPVIIVLASIGLLLAGSFDSIRSIYKIGYATFNKQSYLSAEQLDFIRPGLNVEVLDITVSEAREVSVTIRLTDDLGGPLDVNGINTPGPISVRFLWGSSRNRVASINPISTAP